jgi:acyl carrier protein
LYHHRGAPGRLNGRRQTPSEALIPIWILAVSLVALAATAFVLAKVDSARRRNRNQRFSGRPPVSDERLVEELEGRQQVHIRTVSVVRSAIAQAAGIDDPNRILASDLLLQLRPYGFDDLGVVELTIQIERELGVEIPSRRWAEPKTVGDLIVLAETYRATSGV